MSSPAFCPSVLDGEHWKPCGVGYPTLDEAIEAVKFHFRNQPTSDFMRKGWQQQPNLEFRIYKSDGHASNPTIVEIGPDGARPMMALAVYKIMPGEWASSQPVKRNYLTPEMAEELRELDELDSEHLA